MTTRIKWIYGREQIIYLPIKLRYLYVHAQVYVNICESEYLHVKTHLTIDQAWDLSVKLT